MDRLTFGLRANRVLCMIEYSAQAGNQPVPIKLQYGVGGWIWPFPVTMA
jgi:hypothetical protein